MEEQTDVLAEQTAPDPSPETTPSEDTKDQSQAPAEPQEPSKEEPQAERPNRSQERIRETIAARKAAEQAAATASQEAQYWKEQALAARTVQEREDVLEGVTDEGIDPVAFAKSLKGSLRKELLEEIRNSQGAETAKASFQRELDEVRSDPMLSTEAAQRAVTRIIKAEKVSPTEALSLYKEELEELGVPSGTDEIKARDEAGKFVRKETTAPASGRGSSGAPSSYTRQQIEEMSLEDYAKNAPEIGRQMAMGLIK